MSGLSTAERQKRLRTKRRAEGRCIGCGAADPGGSNCAQCRTKHAAKMAKRYRQRKAAGLCPKCKTPVQGATRCPACTKQDNSRIATSRERKRASGLCRECGIPCDGKNCRTCLDRRKRLRRQRTTAGICWDCPLPATRGLYCGQHYSSRRQRINSSRSALREMAISHYGGKCESCGERCLKLLNIDHVEGGGNRHRRAERIDRLARWLRANGYPPGFQVLCWNCNFRKWVVEHEQQSSNKPASDPVRKERQRRRQVRQQVLDGYGAVCVCCGVTDRHVLTIDHVGGGGKRDRSGYSSLASFYMSIIDRGFPREYRVLCRNCNSGRAVNGGTCPHKEQ